MAWINNLYQTYENSLSVVGVRDDAGNMLLPVAHSTQNAQIEVVLTLEGTISSAKLLDKSEAETVIPVTEDSAAKSNGITPHPLHDKLIYVAGDYGLYCNKKNSKDYYEAYINQLKEWADSTDSNEIVKAIYTYLCKQSLIHDLIELGILSTVDGKLDSKVKFQTICHQEDAFVRFRVDDVNQNIKPLWENRDFFNCYINYYLQKLERKGLCYVTGNHLTLCEKHPSKIRHAADKAKLISANDESGFTFRGRFDSKSQVIGVSYKVSQEAHNALKWLLQKQGYVRDSLALVAWESCNKKIPDMMADTLELMGDIYENESEDSVIVDTAEAYAKKLILSMKGYRQNLDVQSKVTVMSVDAATPGRLSVIYYREIRGSEFLNRIEHWHLTCSWIHNYRWKNEKRTIFIGSPSLRDIVLAAFGTEQGVGLAVSDKLMLYTIERLLPCVVDGAKLPDDIVHAAYIRATMPLTMSEGNWNKVLTIACSLVKKYRKDRFKEEWSMNLDNNCRNYDYLCGRLLAVADEIERWALIDMKDERNTNAKKYFNQFAKNPCKVWKIINTNLQPYEMRLGRRCKDLLEVKQEISSMLDPELFRNLRNLDGTFILGYDCQKRELRRMQEQKKLEKKSNDIVDANNDL